MPHSPLKLAMSKLAFYFGAGLWLGSMALFIAGVAPVLFEELSRDVAGNINVIVLNRLNLLHAVAGVLMGVACLIFNLRLKSLIAKLPLLFIFLALVLLGVYSLGIGTEMMELREMIGSFEQIPPEKLWMQTRFQYLHDIYSALAGIGMALVFLVFIWQSFVFSFAAELQQKGGIQQIVRSIFQSADSQA